MIDLLSMPSLVGIYVDDDHNDADEEDDEPRRRTPLTDEHVRKIICNRGGKYVDFTWHSCVWPMEVVCRFLHEWHEHPAPIDYFYGEIRIIITEKFGTISALLSNFENECRRIDLQYSFADNHSRGFLSERHYRIRNRFVHHLYIVVCLPDMDIFIRRLVDLTL